MEAAMELEGEDSGDNDMEQDDFEDDEMLQQPDEAEDDGDEDEEDVEEDDDDGGDEEVEEGVDPNPNAKDTNKDQDKTVVNVDNKKTEAPKKLNQDAPKGDAAKPDGDKPPTDKKNIQTGDVNYEEIPASHQGAEYGESYTRVVP